MRECELAIIGGGIAGLSCAIYAKRSGLNPVLFERSVLGGQLLFVNKVDNYPGLDLNSDGSKLTEVLSRTVKELGVEIIQNGIDKVSVKDNLILESGQDVFKAQGVVIATGASFRKIGVKGEDELSGKGVSWCAVCDGFFFKNKKVAVIGGGNTAVEEAIYLSGICEKVYLIHRRDELRALGYLQKELLSKNNVEVIWNNKVKEISGNDFVESVTLEGTVDKKETKISLSGVFIAIGIEPCTDLFKGIVNIDESSFITTNEEMQTSQDKIWACGDCRKRPLRQLITAASEGAIAALSAYKKMRNSYISY